MIITNYCKNCDICHIMIDNILFYGNEDLYPILLIHDDKSSIILITERLRYKRLDIRYESRVRLFWSKAQLKC